VGGAVVILNAGRSGRFIVKDAAFFHTGLFSPDSVWVKTTGDISQPWFQLFLRPFQTLPRSADPWLELAVQFSDWSERIGLFWSTI